MQDKCSLTGQIQKAKMLQQRAIHGRVTPDQGSAFFSRLISIATFFAKVPRPELRQRSAVHLPHEHSEATRSHLATNAGTQVTICQPTTPWIRREYSFKVAANT